MRLAFAASAAVAALASTVAFAGCASTPRTLLVDGREVPRPTLTFDGQPYHLRHTRAYPSPGSPSGGLRDAGGDISGRVCGLTVDYEVRHEGDHVTLDGRVDGPLRSRVEVREDGDTRTFTGELGGAKVELTLRADGLSGRVGRREVSLSAAGDQLSGVMHADGGGSSVAIVHGLQALGDMPAADQAAVLPSLMTCALGSNAATMTPLLEVGFGGKGSDAAAESSSLYSRSR